MTELEEELEEIRCEAEANLVEKENEIHNLREQLQLLQRCHIPQSGKIVSYGLFFSFS